MKWLKNIATWKINSTLYMSIIFSWQIPEARKISACHNGKVIVGGPAVMINPIDWAEVQSSTPFDVLSMHNPFATYTTRGCINKCKFCIVPKIEGDLVELDNWKPAPIICDNNLLASSRVHFEKVIDSLRPFPFTDLQGLEAKRFTKWHADQIAKLNKPILRFGFDNTKYEKYVSDAIGIAHHAGLKDMRIYILIGYKDTPEDALYRLEKVREWGLRPFPMRYQPLDTKVKNSYVAPGWTDHELRRMSRYYSCLAYLEHIPYREYLHTKEDNNPVIQEEMML